MLETKIPVYGSRPWGLPSGLSALVLMGEMKIETVKNDRKNWGAWAKLLLDSNRLFENFFYPFVLLNPFLFASHFLEFFPRSRVSLLVFFYPYAINKSSSLRKQPTFGDATSDFPAKWRLRNDLRNSILMRRHYPDLGSAYDWLK